MKTNPVTRLDPMNEVLPIELLEAAKSLMKTGQDESYWASVRVPRLPRGKVRFEVARQFSTFVVPMVGIALAYHRFGLMGLLVSLPVAWAVGYVLDKKLERDIVKKLQAERRLDRGRYRATQWLSERMGMPPEDITLAMIRKMARDYDIVADLVEKAKARIEAERRKAETVDRYARRKSSRRHNGRSDNRSGNRNTTWSDDSGNGYEPSYGPTYPAVNPTTGQQMVPGTYIDVGGHSYGSGGPFGSDGF